MLNESAVWLAKEIRARRLSAEEVMRAYLARIEDTHQQINAVLDLLADPALLEAKAIDQRLAKGENVGPLGGVPLSIKDSIDVAGRRTTSGTVGRKHAGAAEQDATLVARLRAAGAIPIAKTNLPDLLFSFETDNLLSGRTNNPYDVTRTPGGSSGGEAALLAAGGSALGLGSDAFGSVRLPAAFCGLAALKPTSGRLPRSGHVPGPGGWAQAVWQIGPMARRVEDVKAAMQLLAFPDDKDVWSLPVPLDDGRASLRGLRVAFYSDNGFAGCAPEMVKAVEMCAQFLQDEGALVEEERAPGVDQAFELEMGLFGADGAEGIDSYLQHAGSEVVHPYQTNFVSYMRGYKGDAGELAKLWARWDEYRIGIARYFEKYDVVLCPVYPQAALRHGESMNQEQFRGFSYTMAWNMAQAPAATVRCSEHGGLPLNVQVAARPWRDMLTLRVCEAIEERFGGWQAA